MTTDSGVQSSNPDNPMTPSTGGNPIPLCLSDNDDDDVDYDNSYDDDDVFNDGGGDESSLMMDDKDSHPMTPSTGGNTIPLFSVCLVMTMTILSIVIMKTMMVVGGDG